MVAAGISGSSFCWRWSSAPMQPPLVIAQPSIAQPCSLPLTARPFSSQLQRFKRSLSLKTILRSKSVENFFLRSGSELKCPTEVLLTPPTPLPPPSPPPASTDGGLPTPAPSPCPVPRPLAPLKPVRLHSFQEHVFKRASPCELCHQLIVGRYLGPVAGQRRSWWAPGNKPWNCLVLDSATQGHTSNCASFPGETK